MRTINYGFIALAIAIAGCSNDQVANHADEQVKIANSHSSSSVADEKRSSEDSDDGIQTLVDGDNGILSLENSAESDERQRKRREKYEAFEALPPITTAEEYLAKLSRHTADIWAGYNFEPIKSELSSIQAAIVADQLRAQYPIESLRDRLAYEEPLGPLITDRKLGPIPRLYFSFQVSPLSRKKYLRSVATRRATALKELHSEQVEEFLAADGFGSFRGPGRNSMMLNLPDDFMPELHPVPYDSRYGESATIDLHKLDDSEVDSMREEENFEALIEEGVPTETLIHWIAAATQGPFAPQGTHGFVEDIDRVAGFKPHQVRLPKQWSGQLNSTMFPNMSNSNWRINRIELISLLMHQHPVAYNSSEFVPMDQLRKAETRELEQFELDALEQLKSGEKLVIESRENSILMVGGLFTSQSCMECHRTNEGELLGAFSYQILRVPATFEN